MGKACSIWDTKIPNPEKELGPVGIACILGCKAVVQEKAPGKEGYSCGFNREPMGCSGPYNWKGFWQESGKEE